MAFENQAKLYCWEIARSIRTVDKSCIRCLSDLVFVKNIIVRFSVRNCTYECQCITKHQYSSDLWPLSLKAKRNCIVVS